MAENTHEVVMVKAVITVNAKEIDVGPKLKTLFGREKVPYGRYQHTYSIKQRYDDQLLSELEKKFPKEVTVKRTAAGTQEYPRANARF